LADPRGLALGPDGSLYVAETDAKRIRRIAPDGRITTVAGHGSLVDPPGFDGDGGPAVDALFNLPPGIAVGLDGSLYIADQNNGRVRRVGVDGIITTIAGNGTSSSSSVPFGGDGGPAVAAAIEPEHVAVGPDGSLYIWGPNM